MVMKRHEPASVQSATERDIRSLQPFVEAVPDASEERSSRADILPVRGPVLRSRRASTATLGSETEPLDDTVLAEHSPSDAGNGAQAGMSQDPIVSSIGEGTNMTDAPPRQQARAPSANGSGADGDTLFDQGNASNDEIRSIMSELQDKMAYIAQLSDFDNVLGLAAFSSQQSSDISQYVDSLAKMNAEMRTILVNQQLNFGYLDQNARRRVDELKAVTASIAASMQFERMTSPLVGQWPDRYDAEPGPSGSQANGQES
ncbi:uncharacterized protein I303_104908 [Kwoniella dejecticola CBS 10117]|uniref:Uncharacterized protein n=1 Tax=Kwoniella dejecticola CBS 10117 TaxID=1296121 RepID=A0A1A6A3Z8_9TREE|nr:uncharacterized protein I303_05646 [Kwoniella dejecticola CBS 10117]OBR84787.1 hypothetical protein I303_05646 [Kwoniella dejecticola CBS 10117]